MFELFWLNVLIECFIDLSFIMLCLFCFEILFIFGKPLGGFVGQPEPYGVDWCLFCLLGIIYIIYKADPSRAEVPNFQTMPFLNYNSWQVDISKALS